MYLISYERDKLKKKQQQQQKKDSSSQFVLCKIKLVACVATNVMATCLSPVVVLMDWV